MKLLILVLSAFFLQACTTVGSVQRPSSYYDRSQTDERSGIFDEAAFAENDDKIRALLNYRVKLPKANRIAIIKLNRDTHWHYYSDDFTELTDAISKQLIDQLRSSERVYDASFLPAMLVPQRTSIPVLREAAARFQADLLLGYRTQCNSYKKNNFIAADETKSYCAVEAVILDVRSGIIVKSVVSVENFMAIKDADDNNFAETVKKSELEATAIALGNVAGEAVAYLNNVPVL